MKMKVYISADIEGTCGICCWNETNLQTEVGTYYREQMTREVAAACKGAFAAGADEIVIKDAHDTARNIIPIGLPQGNIRLIRGWAGDPECMVTGIDKGFDALVYTGYHSAASLAGNPLSHTMTTSVQRVTLNGVVANEFLINTLTAGYYGVPVVFLSGDKALCEYAENYIGAMQTVATNEGTGASVLSLHPQTACDMIEAGVKKALEDDLSLCKVTMPEEFELVVEYKKHQDAYRYHFYPNAELINPTTVAFRAKDYMAVLKFIMFCI